MALQPQWKIPSWFTAPMEKAQWLYKKLFFEVVIVMAKDNKTQHKIAMSIKISFMHYMKWERIMLPVVFEEFEVAYIFYATFFFSLSLPIDKRSTLAKVCGAAVPQPTLRGFYGPVINVFFTKEIQSLSGNMFFFTQSHNLTFMPRCLCFRK